MPDQPFYLSRHYAHQVQRVGGGGGGGSGSPQRCSFRGTAFRRAAPWPQCAARFPAAFSITVVDADYNEAGPDATKFRVLKAKLFQ